MIADTATGSPPCWSKSNKSAACPVTTTPPPTDTTAPSVSLTSPAAGATVSGQLSVTANAADDVAVAGVQFRLNGSALGAEDSVAPYSTAWNSTATTNGTHTLTAVARDAAGNSSSTHVSVTVSNPLADTTAPNVSLTSPATGATVAGQLSVTANASDNVAVTGVQFRLNGSALGAEVSVAPYSTTWNTTATTNGTHTLTAVARDAAGNSSSTQVSVTVSNPTATTNFPASYFTGPLGSRNILPPTAKGTLIGTMTGGVGLPWQEGWKLTLAREAAIGRQFDLYHIHSGSPSGGCWYAPEGPFQRVLDGKPLERVIADKGGVPVLSWHPGFTVDQAAAGQADDCFRQFARSAKAYGGIVMLRAFWEWNIPGMAWGTQSPQSMITAWRRMVDIIRSEGATNVGFFYCPDEGYRKLAVDGYPGDAYVDWVGSDAYNHNRTDVWHSPMGTGWGEFWQIFYHTPAVSLHNQLGSRKPFVIGETGTPEDPAVAGRKGNWHRNAGTFIRDNMPNLKGYIYFDIDASKVEHSTYNWRLDTSGSSMDGFGAMARMPHFNTRGR
ncbi:MAG TPA: Ig-like domain-containing protein [Gaiellaceae bacterium]|nr:Ig-like domain-containing protein [Gaiellaceae bacterium]